MSGIVVLDTETTGIHPERRVWELGLIVTGEMPAWWSDAPMLRTGSAGIPEPGRYRWFVDAADLDLGNADPFALRVGRFYDRHPQYADVAGRTVGERELLVWVERLTRGQHLLGAVPNFDADVLGRRMRAHGILPSWHHHLCDVEAAAVGYLHGHAAGRTQATEGETQGVAPAVAHALPWRSDDLSRACGVEPPSEEDRHSALGDAEWAWRWWQAITGGTSG